MDTSVSETPRILETLVAAGLVTHELIGDPARLGTESAALAALCARVAGPVYRLGAFHYAFRAVASDLAGRLGEVEPAGRGAAIEASLAAELGSEAVWVNAADVAAEAEAGLDGREILFLKAAESATAAALVEAPELQAVIHAGIAARAAGTAAALTAAAIEGAVAAAGADAARLAGAVEGLTARLGALEASLGGRVEAAARAAIAGSAEPALERLGDALEALVGRLADQAARAAEQSARQDALASGIAALEASMAKLGAAGTERQEGQEAAFAAFEARLGLTLAEFLAQAVPQAVQGPAGTAAGPGAAQVVEMGREPGEPGRMAGGFGGMVRAAQLG